MWHLVGIESGRGRSVERWNHNIHYHRVILRALPDECGPVLDVGCGEGLLCRELADTASGVVGIDLDEPSIELARQETTAADVEYVVGDVMSHPFEPGSFDAVVSVAALHHMGTAAGLERMSELVRPGGVLAVVGVARSRYPADLPFDIAGAIGTRMHKLTKTYWEHSAPTIWPPPETFSETSRIAEGTLPGVRYRRHMLWRYSLIWRRPL